MFTLCSLASLDARSVIPQCIRALSSASQDDRKTAAMALARLNAGVPEYWAVKVGTTRKGPWRLSRNTTVAQGLPVSFFTQKLGLVLPG